MPLQRTCGAENQVRNKLSNGPLRVQSNVRNHRVFCNVRAYVSCRGYVGILMRAWLVHECKVAPRISCYIRPWQKVSFCRGRFLMIPVSKSHKPHVLAHKWFYDLGTRHNMSIKAVRKRRDMRMLGRIAGVRKHVAIRGIIKKKGIHIGLRESNPWNLTKLFDGMHFAVYHGKEGYLC